MKEQITKPQVLTQSLRVKELITELLIAIGENPHRSGLKETPDRVAKSYGELFSGIHEATPRLKTFFREEKNDIVIVRDIPLFSMCEHHLLPFFGR
jgi:GTP cyclohydrolase I